MNYFKAKNKTVEHRDSYQISNENMSILETLFVHDNYEEDFKTLKNELQQIGYAVPTLYKQYSDLCEEDGVEFMDFGADKEFDNCVDVFIVVDTQKLEAQKRKRYMTN